MRVPILAIAALALAGVASNGATPERGKIVDGIEAAGDPSQTYAVYLPSSYDPEGAHPLLLVFDPRSRGAFAAELFRAGAESHGWIIVSSNNTRSDGAWEPNIRAVNAIWPDAMKRFAADPKRVYAAGFSGGAIVAWATAVASQKIAGIIAVGGHLPPEVRGGSSALAHFGAVGGHDFNYLEMREADAYVAGLGAPHRLEVFDGEHAWLPPSLASTATRWLEIVAMREGIRALDEGLISRALAEEIDRAESLEAKGEILAASRHHRMIAETFEGLADVKAHLRRAEELISAPEGKRQAKDEQRWAEWEREQLRNSMRILARIDDPETPFSSTRVASDLRLSDLRKRAAREGEEGAAASRVLASIFVRASFYLPRQLMGEKRWHQAANVLELARSIRETFPVDYDLAAMYARSGKETKAFEMLERAVELGFESGDHLRADEDFATIRESPRFRKILADLEAPE